MNDIEKAIRVMQQHKCKEISLYGDEYNLAIEALQEKAERENQKPLTLEEINSMDSEAIRLQWYSRGNIISTQVLINIIKHSFINCYGDDIDFGVIENQDAIAYRYKPKEG